MAFFSMIKALLLCNTSLSLLLTTPASGKGFNYLLSGDRLNAGEALEVGDYKFIIENDCNLSFYNFGTEKWSSNTKGLGKDCYLTLNRIGELNIINKKGIIIWKTGTKGKDGNYILILQRNHEVAIYGPSVWSNDNNNYESDDVVVATALNGTIGVSSQEQNNVREMGKIMEVMSDA
ncbi:mannose-specific lectin-like [Dendrobium catenatum]|uniref:Mannose-specific lectin n=1 Tax=Dendrobium catenatum TaxID=906689 RepID=A0A2I0VX88_9ASPA|nr:mannose-specific lectin-like [Dendrobium catenatum]PKU68031.1 Mannose-specific lectin [Dendrobium catenatum]